jgi:hypothetical protein
MASATIAGQQAKSIKLEALRLREEARVANYVAELASAKDQNTKVLDKIRTLLQEMYAANLIAGILLPVSPDKDGSLYVRFEAFESANETLSKFAITGPGGRSCIFVGGFANSASKFAEIRISGEMLSKSLPSAAEEADFGMGLPGSDQIRAYLNSLASIAGSSEHDALLRIRRKLNTQQARYCREFHKAFNF